MNKEELAKEYAIEKWIDRKNDNEFKVTYENCINDTIDDFVAGFDAAQPEQDEFTISFAIWYAKLKNEVTADYLNMSDYELLEIFRESLNKK